MSDLAEMPGEHAPGYDDGYLACRCFWGDKPGSLVRALEDWVESFEGLRVLDAGCGEGKNAVYLAARGAIVDAFDASAPAIDNGRAAFGASEAVRWAVDDIRTKPLAAGAYDIVIAYGLLHCLKSPAEIASAVEKLQAATATRGYLLLCAMNDRAPDLRAHPGFEPTLLSHSQYQRMFEAWELLLDTDTDLWETHPHNGIPHTHSMTRLAARRLAT